MPAELLLVEREHLADEGGYFLAEHSGLIEDQVGVEHLVDIDDLDVPVHRLSFFVALRPGEHVPYLAQVLVVSGSLGQPPSLVEHLPVDIDMYHHGDFASVTLRQAPDSFLVPGSVGGSPNEM